MSAVIRDERPRARKARQCWLCTYDIQPGTVYVRRAGVDGGSWWDYAAHVGCDGMAADIGLWDKADDSLGFGDLATEVNQNQPQDVRAWRDGWPREVIREAGAARVIYAVVVAAHWLWHERRWQQ